MILGGGHPFGRCALRMVDLQSPRPRHDRSGQHAFSLGLGPTTRSSSDGFDDPKVQGVACHISRAETGGVKGQIGRGGGYE